MHVDQTIDRAYKALAVRGAGIQFSITQSQGSPNKNPNNKGPGTAADVSVV